METGNNQRSSEFDQFVLYKALAHKFNDSSYMLDRLLDEEHRTGHPDIKNVCAKIHVSLSTELDEVCAFLDVSKREFIELALIDAIKRAKSAIHPVIDDLVARSEAIAKEGATS